MYGYIARTVYAPTEKAFRQLLKGIPRKRHGEIEDLDVPEEDGSEPVKETRGKKKRVKSGS
jgi:hypothetical protein